MKTLQDHYKLIKEGKGHKDVFLKEAKQLFPNYIRNAATFNEVSNILKDKNIISENLVSLEPINTISRKKESYEDAFESFLKEARNKKDEDPNADLKKVSQQVEDKLKHNFDRTDKKNPDNHIFGEIMKGYYCEMKDPKNVNKTENQLRDIVLKNLAKDPIYYTKNGMFGEKGIGLKMDAPGLGEPKEAKGKYKSSGYSDLKENKDPLEKFKDTVKQSFTSSNTPKPTPEQIKADLEKKRKKELETRESKIREAIRYMVNQELEEVRGDEDLSEIIINTSSIKGKGGKRFIPTIINMPLSIRKRFGEHIVYNQGSETFYISQILYNNLIKGYANNPTIKNLIRDIPPMLKQLLNKTENYNQPTELPKQFKMYLAFREPVEKAKTDKFNKDGTKKYWSEGDFLFPNLNKEKYSPEEIQEQSLRNTIRESVEKELLAINKEAESEVISTKLEKIEAAIEKRQSQLNKLDEDEDMKALTDKTKIKQAQKDIKTLEKAKAKLEKNLSKIQKKSKKKISPDIIDETELNEIDPKGIEAATNASGEMVKNFKDIESTISKIELEEGENIDIRGIIKKKYKNIPNEDIKSFINMHSQDIETEEDVMYQFEEFLTVNPEILNRD
jgi:hypothetical protein